MKTKIGRFSAYVPDKETFYTFLQMLSISLPGNGMEFESSLPELHKFFYEMKNSYPKLFDDVYFKQTPDFPYSKEIAECFIRLQESGYVSRPNPSFNIYKIVSDLKEEQPDAKEDDFKALHSIAKKFNEQFKVKDKLAC